jgi:hypothetical protein
MLAQHASYVNIRYFINTGTVTAVAVTSDVQIFSSPLLQRQFVMS